MNENILLVVSVFFNFFIASGEKKLLIHVLLIYTVYQYRFPCFLFIESPIPCLFALEKIHKLEDRFALCQRAAVCGA